MKQKNRNFKTLLLIICIGILFVLFMSVLLIKLKYIDISGIPSYKSEILESEQPEQTPVTATPDTEKTNISEKVQKQADSLEEQTEYSEPLTTQEVYPSDIYSEADTDVVFQCYNVDAVSYNWEYYDVDSLKWVPVEKTAVRQKQDELYRNSSFCSIQASPVSDETMLRCTICLENGEKIVKIASLHVLEKKVENIEVEKTEYEAGNYISIYEIPIMVTYEDGSKETITGLNGLHFLDEKEDTEYTNSVSGNRVETITTVHTECDFLYMGTEEKEIFLRYRKKNYLIDNEVLLCGKDYEPPTISAVDIGDFKVSMEDKVVPVTVTITAEDNDTPFPYLEYAFLPENQEVTESDWAQKFAFEVDITKNGTWVAYCRDKNGNISKEERKIIAVDQKAPVISLSLAENNWSQSNKIIVDAVDELSVEFLYSCPATGEDSGWITYNEYQVSHNGTWNVQVKDAAGNISSSEIVVSNIDTQAPVIISITTEGE